MTAQERFNFASRRYNDARRLIAEMSMHLGEIKDFDINVAYRGFDVIVQYILLRTAMADGKFQPIEGEFIDKITESFDILNMFKDVPEGFCWHVVAASGKFAEAKTLIDEIEKIAKDHMYAFAQLYALADFAATKRDYLSEMIECVRDISLTFVLIDGEEGKDEVKVAAETCAKYLVAPWQYMMQEFAKRR